MARIAVTLIHIDIAIACQSDVFRALAHLTPVRVLADEVVLAEAIGKASLTHTAVRVRRHRRVVWLCEL